MPSSQVFCTASHFLLPYATRFDIFTTQTPVRCELTLRGAAWEIQVTPTHPPPAWMRIAFIPQEQTLTRDQKPDSTRTPRRPSPLCSENQPRHSLCVAAFSLQWISEKFQTQDLLVQYKTVYLGNTTDERETSSSNPYSHLKHISFPRSPRQSTAASDNFISQFIWVWKCKLSSLLV